MRKIKAPAQRTLTKAPARVAQPRQTLAPEERLKLVYSTRQWRRLRQMFKDHGWTRCQGCRVLRSDMLDHILPIQHWPGLAFDPRNCQPMCRSCHEKKTERIDAPGSDPLKYRHDRKHEADMRSPELKRWANEVVDVGLAALLIGDFAIGSAPAGRFDGVDLSC